MDFAQTYASLSDEELLQTYGDRLNLRAEALAALEKEVHLRGLDVSGIAAAPKVVPPAAASFEEAALATKLGVRLALALLLLLGILAVAFGRR